MPDDMFVALVRLAESYGRPVRVVLTLDTDGSFTIDIDRIVMHQVLVPKPPEPRNPDGGQARS